MIEKYVNIAIDNRYKPFHWHEDVWEIDFVLRGSAVVAYYDERIELKAGDLWCVNPEMLHVIENVSDDFVYMEVGLKLKNFEKYIPGIKNVYFKISPTDEDEFRKSLKDEIIDRLCSIVNLWEHNTWSMQREQDILSACLDIINNLRIGFDLILSEAGKSSKDEQVMRVWRITDFIFDNCNRKLSLKEVAEREHISEGHLARILKNVSGSNFEETVARIRVECSIKYLLETDMTITDIAYTCGFSAVRYFNAAFQKIFGCTPAEFRKKVKSSFKNTATIASDSIIYSPELDRDEVNRLLKKYTKNISLAWEVEKINIDLSALHEKHQVSKNMFYIDTIRCTAEELMDYRNYEAFRRCINDIGIKNVLICSERKKSYHNVAEKNAVHLGLIPVKECKEYIDFNRLFLKENIPSRVFYTAKIYYDIKIPYIIFKKNTILYKENEIVKLIISNRAERSISRIKVCMTDPTSNASYLLSKFIVREFEEEELKIINSFLDGNKIAMAMEFSVPGVEKIVIHDINEFEIEESLEPQQTCLYTFVKMMNEKNS